MDSACINHVRIAYAGLQGHYEGPTYDQNAWVNLHGYGNMPWSAVLDQWRARYSWMAEMITNLPQEAMDAKVTLADHDPVRLEDWVRDCLEHLEHHVSQINSAA